MGGSTRVGVKRGEREREGGVYKAKKTEKEKRREENRVEEMKKCFVGIKFRGWW